MTTPTSTSTGAARPATRVDSAATRMLTACGVVAGPLFVASVLVQMAVRAGFDPVRHPLSLLSLGPAGWVQIATFVVCGILATAGAVGLRRVLGGQPAGTWGPILFGVYGVGLVWGGVFPADLAFGFPPGTPDGPPAELSTAGVLHGIAPAAAGIALIAACFVFARRYVRLGERGWAAYCLATVVADVALTAASFAGPDYRLMLAGGALVWIWAAAVTAHERRG
jgi:hypothetical protein